ncbi:hypothetical protein GBA52_018004 [Prunus armeniaca]|nr:hypothetical protein GBA52_018004 [Prunus armeniaca]
MVISTTSSERGGQVNSTFASRYVRNALPKFEMPETSIPKDAAYQIIKDELMLDGNPRLNLASFVTTWMEPECDQLIMASLNKNYVDMDEYPVTTELQNRCVNIIANLFNAPLGDGETAVGVGTVGSSEAMMLAGLAFKRKWQQKRKAEGKPYDKPNMWDFRLPLVKSINVSGHKYGLVYAGVGWVVWRSKEDLPDELVFHINYLGSDQPTFTLNFSKGSSQIIAQYYQFIRLGFEGYKNVMENCMENTRFLREGLEKTGRFEIVSKDIGVPLVAFSLKDSSKHTVFEISESLRKFGWIVPAYTMPANAEHIAVLRVVVREDFSRGLAERLISDIIKVVKETDTLPSRISTKTAHVTATVDEVVCSSEGTVKPVKKSVEEIEQEITRRWKGIVDRKKRGVC